MVDVQRFAPSSRPTTTGPVLVKAARSGVTGNHTVDENDSETGTGVSVPVSESFWQLCTMNRIMDTSSFESGSFWLFVDPPLPIYRLAIFGLVCVGVGYMFILIKLARKQPYATRVSPENGPRKRVEKLSTVIMKAIKRAATKSRSSRSLSSAASLVTSLASDESVARQRLNLCMKIVDLIIETVMLLQILEDGLPVVLVAVFTIIVAANAVGCAFVMLVPFEQTVLVENLVDLIFDFLIAVGYPVIVVCYCLSTFKFDRVKMAINLQVFPPGWSEQGANSIADPVQTVVVYKSLKSLRISSVFNFFTRMGINITLWLKILRITNFIENARKQSTCVYPTRNRVAAVPLVIFALLLVVYVEESTRTSAAACRPHPECYKCPSLDDSGKNITYPMSVSSTHRQRYCTENVRRVDEPEKRDDQSPIEMRRRQIAQGVGDPCNPEYEAWLGCK